MRTCFLFLMAMMAMAAEPTELIRWARSNSAGLDAALTGAVPPGSLSKGTAFVTDGPDVLLAVAQATRPVLIVDGEPGPQLQQTPGGKLWHAVVRLKEGRSHSFNYLVDGKPFGGNLNVPVFGPESYAHEGVPQGKLSEMQTHKSKIFDGMESEYWIYVPAQYTAAVPAAVMIWNDGRGHITRGGGSRLMDTIDNLTAEKKIPVMIQIFISPGDISKSPGSATYDYVSKFSNGSGRQMKDAMRSTEYDTVTDRYARFLEQEIIPEVAAKYNLRKDAYSRAIAGESSGGIAAFNAAYFRPDLFGRVFSRIGTFTSIQWIPGSLDGGNIYPFKIRKEPKKNIRVWLQDGSEDLENQHGSWPLQNIQMANSLKMMDYDFHLAFGNGAHSTADGNAQAPEALTWLWRDYDPSKAEQTFTQDESEKAKPLFRVRIANR